MEEVFIVSGVRTPIAAFRGSFASLTSVDLGVIAGKEALKASRFVSFHTPSVSIFRSSRSLAQSCRGDDHGLRSDGRPGAECEPPDRAENRNSGRSRGVYREQSVRLIAEGPHPRLPSDQDGLSERPAGRRDGVDDQRPVLPAARGDHGYGELKLTDAIQRDGITDATLNDAMGLCAEKSAKDYGCSRADQDAFAVESYARAAESWKTGAFEDEVKCPNGEEIRWSSKEDEEYKRLIKEKVPTLPAAFLKDGTGTITAANASSLNDGAASLVVVSESFLKAEGLKPLAKVVGYAEAGRAPVDFTVAPINAVEILLQKSGLDKKEIARWEVNEAFSVTALAFIKHFGLDPKIVNSRGGAVALGHPIGMSGARIVVTLAHQLTAGQMGIAAICNGGGNASAVLIQRV
ncbi:hypothetical protein M3Y99_01322100 [Aphelenchoides fujianensis]|nr:hypothetical protein M3Y99_01322100 [Aphelenchoides fujianensis]